MFVTCPVPCLHSSLVCSACPKSATHFLSLMQNINQMCMSYWKPVSWQAKRRPKTREYSRLLSSNKRSRSLGAEIYSKNKGVPYVCMKREGWHIFVTHIHAYRNIPHTPAKWSLKNDDRNIQQALLNNLLPWKKMFHPNTSMMWPRFDR